MTNNKPFASVLTIFALAFLLFFSIFPFSHAAPATPPLHESLFGWQVFLDRNQKIIPSTPPPRSATNATISIVSLRDMHAIASFAIRSRSNISKLTLSISPLQSDTQNTLQTTPDFRLVKCWYQRANAWYGIPTAPGAPVLTPELLLHDDSLVVIDREKHQNLIRISPASASSPSYRTIQALDGSIPPDETLPTAETLTSLPFPLPADDAPALLPFSLAANETRQLVLSIPIPESAKPGLYSANISLIGDGSTLGHFELSLRILPQHLPLANSRFSESFFSKHFDPFTPVPATLALSPSQTHFSTLVSLPPAYITRNTIAKLRSDGIDSPILPKSFSQKSIQDLFKDQLPPSFWVQDGSFFDIFPPSFPFPVITTSSPRAFRAPNDLFTQNPTSVSANLSNIYDIPQADATPPSYDTQLLDYWRSIGVLNILHLSQPSALINPTFWRHRLGFQAFKSGYDGFIINAISSADPWNCWASHSPSLLYPTQTGFIDTLAWMGVREAILDVRILSFARRLADRTRLDPYFKVNMEGEKFGNWLFFYSPGSLETMRLLSLAWIDRLDSVASIGNNGRGLPTDPTLTFPSTAPTPPATSFPVTSTASTPPSPASTPSSASTPISVPRFVPPSDNSGDKLFNAMKSADAPSLPFSSSDENLSASIAFHEHAFVISLSWPSQIPLDKIGGSLSFYLIDGADNTGRNPPIAFTYNFNNPNAPFTFTAPSFPSQANPAIIPTIKHSTTEKATFLLFTFPWSAFSSRLPFTKAREPIPWRMILTRTTASKKTSSVGTLASPIRLNWQKPDSAAFATMIENAIAAHANSTAKSALTSLISQISLYKQEGEIIYADSPRQTFEPKNVVSDKIFLTHYLRPLAEQNNPRYNAISNLKSAGQNRPKVLADAEEFRFYQEFLDSFQRDYLFARFLNRPIPALRAKTAAELDLAERKKRESERASISDDAWEESESIIDLNF